MAISKGLLLAGLAASGLGLVAATAKKKPKAGEPGGTPASALPGAEKEVPAEITTSMVRALETGNPTRIRAQADILEKSGYKAQAADLRAGAVLIEKEEAKKKREAEVKAAEEKAAAAMKAAEEKAAAAIKAAEAKAASAAAAAAKAVPTDISSTAAVQAVVQKAIASGSSAAMRATAAELRKSGANAAATSLETAAAAIDAQMSQLAAATAATPAATVTPTVVTPGVVEAVQAAAKKTPTVTTAPVVVKATPTGPTKQQKAALAGRVALAMKGAKKGKENKALVTAYQQQESLPKKDGLYGSAVALSIANTYDIVPPKPLYWGTKSGGYASYVQDKKDYKAALLAKSVRDPARSEEWTRAANV